MADEVEKIEEKDYRIEVTKNTKGYNWSVRATSNDTEELKKKVEELEEWCKTSYSSKE